MLKQSRSRYPKLLRICSFALSITCYLSVLCTLLAIICSALHFQRRTDVQARLKASYDKSQQKYVRPRTALLTLADPSFQSCALQLVRGARRHGWKDPIYLLSVDLHNFDAKTIKALHRLRVVIIETNPILDQWFLKEVKGSYRVRKLDPFKFRKMDLFLNPIFRVFERLVFLDADGIIGSKLEPLAQVRIPENITVLMRQNDKSFGKDSLWSNEAAVDAFTSEQSESFVRRFPDREKTGSSCFFIVDVKKLQAPVHIMRNVLDILCNYRTAFRYNDQSLMNLLFYHNMGLIPWCLWDEVQILDTPSDLLSFCREHMKHQRWLNGELTFMYRHMSPTEKSVCRKASLQGKRNGANFSHNSKNKTHEATIVDRRRNTYLHDEVRSEVCLEALEQWERRLLSKRVSRT